MLTEKDISRIVARVVGAYSPLLVGTFGSYPGGRAQEKSDLDLLVIRRTHEAPDVRRSHVRRALFGVLYPVDIHVFTPEEFLEEIEAPFSFAWAIAGSAKVYFAGPGSETVVAFIERHRAFAKANEACA